jgi:hypothetical protein
VSKTQAKCFNMPQKAVTPIQRDKFWVNLHITVLEPGGVLHLIPIRKLLHLYKEGQVL